MYFSYFPYTYYSLDDRRSVQLITNILLRNKFNDTLKNNYSLYDEYDILDGETPEIVADKFYNNPQLHWIILHMNDIIDPRFEWLLSASDLVSFCQAKYTNINDIHHYVDVNGNYVFVSDPQNPGSAIPVTNYQYEEELNEGRRRIKVLKPQYIEVVLKDFESKLSR